MRKLIVAICIIVISWIAAFVLFWNHLNPFMMWSKEIVVPSLQEKAERIMSIATWWGIPQTGLEMKKLHIWDIEVVAEIADTEEKRRVGEMFRWAMKERDAMLFVFEQDKVLSFWMQNTYIGLDLLYVDNSGIIKHIHNNAKPLDLKGLPSTVAVRYVIEVRDDFVENFGVKVGDKVEGI